MSNRRAARAVLIIGVMSGCGHDEDPFGNNDPSPTSGDSSDTSCIAGERGCPCSDEPVSCHGALVCDEDVCVPAPSGDDTGFPPVPPPGDDSTSGQPPVDTTCTTADDCADTDICAQGECSHAWSHRWSMTVDYFEPASCVETFGDVDPDYLVWRDETLLTDSPEATCPSAWPDQTTILEPFIDAPDRVVIDFWDNDLFTDAELICTLGWDSFGNGTLGPVPAAILRHGFWSGDFDGANCYAELTFTRIE